MPEIWYSACQAIICLFAGASLFSMYRTGTPDREPRGGRPGRETGLFWLGWAVLLWGLLGVWLWLGPRAFPAGEAAVRYVRIFASIPNSAFLLLAAAYLDYGPAGLKFIQTDRKWRLGVLLSALVVGLVTLFLPERLSSAPDVVLSIFTLVILGYGLERSFRLRRFRLLAHLAVLAISSQVFAQILELLPRRMLRDWREERWILNLTSKTTFIMISLALAMTWAFEGWVILRAAKEMRFRFTGVREGKSWIIEMESPDRIGDRRIRMSEKPHQRFLRFAVRRVRHADSDGSWLKLLPESLDHKDLERICDPLGLKRPELFQNDGSGSYRLTLPPANLRFDREALAQDPDLRRILSELDG